MKFVLLFLLASVSLAHAQRMDWKEMFQKGEDAHDAGDARNALKYFNLCLQENPSVAEAYFMRGAAKEQLEDLMGANTDYNIYLELKPDRLEAVLNRGIVRYRLGLFDQAKEDFLKLLTLPPGETQSVLFNTAPSVSGSNQIMTVQSSINPQVFNYLGLVETKLKNYQQAVRWFDSAIHIAPRDPDYFVNRGLAKESANDTTAIEDYKAAIKINPDHTNALHNIAVWKRKRGEKSDTEDDIDRAIASDSSMLYPYLERGFQRMEGGYYKGALEDYNMALKISDKDPEIWLSRGYVKEKLNDLRGAYDDYTKAIELDEKYEKAWLNRANVLGKQGKLQEAIEDYTVAITFNPEFGSAFYNRAIAKNRLKKTSEACEDLRKAESLGVTVDEKMKSVICK